MTDNQKKNLEKLANALATGRKDASESFIVGQIMISTDRPYDKALEGLCLMQREKILPEAFIRPQTVGAIDRMMQNSPALKILFEKFDCIPGETQIVEFQGFVKPKPVDVLRLKKVFSLPEF
jgi:hypothetical protein